MLAGEGLVVGWGRGEPDGGSEKRCPEHVSITTKGGVGKDFFH